LNRYNPYVLLTPEILVVLCRQPMFLVRQYFPRGHSSFDPPGTIPLLLTHYIHHEVDAERARRHMRLLFKDRYRCLYNSADDEHRERLLKAAMQPAGYKIYINLLPGEWKASDTLKRKIGQYVQQRLPHWNYSPADKLKVTLKDRFGELYLSLLWKHQQMEVHLDEIETGRVCATT
jgi:hypothetical protein